MIKGSIVQKGRCDHQNGQVKTTDSGVGEDVETLEVYTAAEGAD